MGAHTSSSKVSTQAGFIHGFSGKNKICSTPVCRLRVPVWRRRLEVGMIISETVGHFFHIKVTAGNIRRGFCAELSLENTGLFGFDICIRMLEFPSAGLERVPKPAANT